MKKILAFFGILCLLPFSLAACATQAEKDGTTESSNAATTEETNMSVADFLDKVAQANEKVETVHFDMDLSFQINEDKKSQDMQADIDYGNTGGTIQRAHALIDEVNNGQETYQEYILPGGEGNPVYLRTSKDGAWEKQLSDGRYYIQPGYFSFLKILSSMENDLELEESSDRYTLVIKSQNIDLVSLFKDELNLFITGISQTEVEKGFKVTFDKKTLYMTGFEMTFEYEGSAGDLHIDVETAFSSWNQLEEAAFQAPDNAPL